MHSIPSFGEYLLVLIEEISAHVFVLTYIFAEIYRLVIKRPNMSTDDSHEVPSIGQGDKVELGAPAGGDAKEKKKCGC